MHWEWVVPVIAVVLWILSSVIRAPEEPPRNLPRRRLPDGRPAGEPARPSSEVERFLEEINRLRKRASEEQKTAEAREEEPRAEPPPRPRPEPPPTPRRIPRRPPTVVAPPRRVVVETPPTPVAPPPSVALPVVEGLEIIGVASPLSAAKPAQRLAAPAVAPAVAQLRALLTSPQNLQTAVLLQEVLGQPRCRRRHR
jgi:hypothetical protein